MSKLLRVLFRFVVGLAVLPILGAAVARLIYDDGIGRFRGDRIAHAVAEKSYSMAWVQRDNPIQRLFSPVARVVMVAQQPGHCTDPISDSQPLPLNSRSGFPALVRDPERSDRAVLREYTAQVRFYTFFGYPVDDVYLTCGGSASSANPPAGATVLTSEGL